MAKMSAEERKQFYLKALEEQRHLLRASIERMAAGDLVEALRVATSIRVFVHETGSSKPLLKRLDANYLELPIIDRKPDAPANTPPGVQTVVFFCPVCASLKAPEGTVSLNTDINATQHTPSKLGDWWENACMVLPGIGPVSRRELILGLSHKEGGTHVDDDISQKYQNVMASKFFTFKLAGTDVPPLSISRLVAGRAGVEMLDCLDKNFA